MAPSKLARVHISDALMPFSTSLYYNETWLNWSLASLVEYWFRNTEYCPLVLLASVQPDCVQLLCTCWLVR